MLAGSQGDIGFVAEHPFTIDYKGHDMLGTKPIYYPPPQRVWTRKELGS